MLIKIKCFEKCSLEFKVSYVKLNNNLDNILSLILY